MKNHRLTSLLLVAALLLTGMGTATAASTSSSTQLKVRPTSASATLTTIPSGATVTPTGNAGTAYVEVRHGNSLGWMLKSALPTATISARVNLRSRPTQHSTRMTTLPVGAEVIMAGGEGSAYIEVHYGRRTGWILKSGLASGKPVLNTATLLSRPTNSSSKLTTISAGSTVFPTGNEGTAYLEVRFGSRTGWILKSALNQPPVTINATYQTNRTNTPLRASKNSQAVIRTLSVNGTKVKMVERHGSSAKIKFGGKYYWGSWSHFSKYRNPGVAVYGTLRKGQSAYHLLNGKTESEVKTKILNHVMYMRADQTWWTFILPRNNGQGVVAEEMNIKPAIYSKTINELDKWERFDPNKPLYNQTYNRKKVNLAVGRQAWAYVASPMMQNYLNQHGIYVKSGDYLRRF